MTNNPGTYEEVPCDILAHTEKAVKIDVGGDREYKDMHWVPKSLLDPDEEWEMGNDQTLYIERWFVEKEEIQ